MSLKIGSKGADVKKLQKALGITDDGDFGPATEARLKAFQTEKGLTVDGIAGSQVFKALGIAEQQREDHIVWRLPKAEPGCGYRRYNAMSGNRDAYGVKKTIDAIVHIGKEWHKISPDLDIQIGDISLKHHGRRGPRLLPHKSHRKGIDVDLRPLSDEGYIPMDWRSSQYGPASKKLNEKFVRLVRKLYPNCKIYFNDKDLRAKGLTRYLRAHDNHYHLRFTW